LLNIELLIGKISKAVYLFFNYVIQWFGFQVPEVREETLVNLVAVKMEADQVL